MDDHTNDWLFWVAGVCLLIALALFAFTGCVSSGPAFTAPEASHEELVWPDGTRQVLSMAKGASASGEGIKGIAGQTAPSAGPEGANAGTRSFEMFDLASITSKFKLASILLWGGKIGRASCRERV